MSIENQPVPPVNKTPRPDINAKDERWTVIDETQCMGNLMTGVVELAHMPKEAARKVADAHNVALDKAEQRAKEGKLGEPDAPSDRVKSTGQMERIVPFHEAEIDAHTALLYEGLIYDLPDDRRVEVWQIKDDDGLCIRIFRPDNAGNVSKLLFGLTLISARALMSGLVEKLSPELLSERPNSSTASGNPESSSLTTSKA